MAVRRAERVVLRHLGRDRRPDQRPCRTRARATSRQASRRAVLHALPRQRPRSSSTPRPRSPGPASAAPASFGPQLDGTGHHRRRRHRHRRRRAGGRGRARRHHDRRLLAARPTPAAVAGKIVHGRPRSLRLHRQDEERPGRRRHRRDHRQPRGRGHLGMSGDRHDHHPDGRRSASPTASRSAARSARRTGQRHHEDAARRPASTPTAGCRRERPGLRRRDPRHVDAHLLRRPGQGLGRGVLLRHRRRAAACTATPVCRTTATPCSSTAAPTTASTVAGIGLDKAANIFWRTQDAYLTPTSDFADLADGLDAACADLVGSADQQGVDRAERGPGPGRRRSPRRTVPR